MNDFVNVKIRISFKVKINLDLVQRAKNLKNTSFESKSTLVRGIAKLNRQVALDWTIYLFKVELLTDQEA